MKTTLSRNILFFQSSILPKQGGVPRVSDVISKELTKRGYKCFFIFYEGDNEEYSQKIKMKISLNNSYKYFELQILNFIKENNIHTFVCQNAYSYAFIKVYKKIRLSYPSQPFISFLHASPDYWRNTYSVKSDKLNHKALKNNLKKLLKKILFPIYNPYVRKTAAIYNLSDAFVLQSESFKKTFLELYVSKKMEDKLYIIPNPLTYPTYIHTAELPNKEKTVLIVARLEETQKKIYAALKIWGQLNKINAGWKLTIIGTGPDEGFYKSYVARHELNNVVFLGEKANVLEHYKTASLFIMTSIWEGFPMTLLEASQNGVVSVAFDNFAAIYDIILNGETGYIVQNNDIDQFAEKLSFLMANEKERIEMAKKTIDHSSQFHVSNIVDKWEIAIGQIELKYK